MSLDCYPLGQRRTINLVEQPLALDVAYNDDLLISISDQCRTINIHDLSCDGNLFRTFSLGKEIVLDQVVYCRTGDYLACVGDKDGEPSIHVVTEWRKALNEDPSIVEINLNRALVGNKDKLIQLNSIDCCQNTGNLAVSTGELILIYKYKDDDEINWRDDILNDEDSNHSKAETIKANPIGPIYSRSHDHQNGPSGPKQYFEHIISVRLSICAMRICLLENYLSITAADHVQVLKLELLTLQIQSDGLDGCEMYGIRNDFMMMNPFEPLNYNGVPSETTSTTTTTTATSRSVISDSNSTTTNFSSFTINEQPQEQQLNDSGMSIITINSATVHHNEPEYMAGDPNQLADDCITWNLNTKKLVKLPTLMHNTSSNLSSYHICHPLELLGPASESIACRVNASIYSPDFSQNQLEAVVMLCKQFDFDRDPVKSAHLQAVYLSSLEDQRRISKSASAMMDHDSGCDQASGCGREATLLKSADYELLASVTCFVATLANCFIYSLHGKKVLCSQTITHPDLCLDLRPDLLNVYLLTPLGLQICSSGICDFTFRYDWSSSSDLNLSFIATDRIRILTTRRFVILVASSLNGQCEVEYLEKPNLSALLDRIVDTVNHCNSISIRANMLTYLHASSHLALIASNSDKTSNNSSDTRSTVSGVDSQCNHHQGQTKTRDSIVSNLKSITIMLCKQLLQKRQTNVITNNRIDKAIKHLLDISMCGLSELMRRHLQSEQEKRTNCHVEISDSIESEGSPSMAADAGAAADARSRRQRRRRLATRSTLVDDDAEHRKSISNDGEHYGELEAEQVENEKELFMSSDEDEADKPLDSDYELIRIYLKHSKYSQWLLDYLVSISRDENMIRRVIDYIFEHNPRLLIKCAQRYPLVVSENDEDDDEHFDRASSMTSSSESESRSRSNGGGEVGGGRTAFCMNILVEKLEQLVEFDSTGINRATVLFTLAALYNSLGDTQKCLAALGQIKPLNHLAITMCSNYELSQSIVGVVCENYPDVHALYLRQLSKRDWFAKSVQQPQLERKASGC